MRYLQFVKAICSFLCLQITWRYDTTPWENETSCFKLWNILLDSFRALILYNLIERGNKKERERERNRKKLRTWLDQFEKQGYAS